MGNSGKNSGGPGSGGPRENSGRPEKSSWVVDSPELETDDPVEFLRALMRDSKVDIKLRQDSAKRLIALDKSGKDVSGKKAQRAVAAENASQGRFAAIAPPKLVSVK